MASVDDRIALLERRVRGQQVVAALAVVVALAAVVVATKNRPGETVSARAFHLVNAEGKTLARLGVTDGAPVMAFYPPGNGGQVLVGALGDDLAGLGVISGDGKTVVQVATGREGNPTVSLTDKGHKAMLSSGWGRQPTLLLFGDQGKLAATGQYVWLKDPTGTTVFSTEPGGGPPAAEQASPDP
jgi:hypothetical protein